MHKYPHPLQFIYSKSQFKITPIHNSKLTFYSKYYPMNFYFSHHKNHSINKDSDKCTRETSHIAYIIENELNGGSVSQVIVTLNKRPKQNKSIDEKKKIVEIIKKQYTHREQ